MDKQTGIRCKTTKKGHTVTRLDNRVTVYGQSDTGYRGVLSDITYPSNAKARHAMNEIE